MNICGLDIDLRKFISDDNGDIFCAICKRKGVWEDCPKHPDYHYSMYCPKCGIEDMDCENDMVMSL